MARFRETYITIDDFTGMQEVGIRYEGFVIGLGYAYVDSSTLMPLNMNGFLNRPNIPPKFNKFTLLIYQYVDASPEMVELSMRGIANNRAKTYTVQRGDTLTAIAQEHKVSVEDLVKWNKIANADIIFAGQTLIVSQEAYDYLNIEKVNSVHSNMSTSYSVSANEHYRKNDAVYRADAYAREMQRREEWSKPVLPPSPNKEWEEHSKTRTNFLLGSQDNPSQFGEVTVTANRFKSQQPQKTYNENFGNAINAYAIPSQIKNTMLGWAAKNADNSPALNKYLGISKGVTRKLGWFGVGLKTTDYIQDPTTANLLNVGVSAGSIYIPYGGGVIVIILDLTGASNHIYDYVGNAWDNWRGHSVGNHVYNKYIQPIIP